MAGIQAKILLLQNSYANNMTQTNSGFIALMSAIIISIVLLGIVLTGGLTGFFGRFNVLDSESKERSVAAAESCIDLAVLDYINKGKITITGGEDCEIKFKDDTSNPITILSQSSSINHAYTNIKAVINTDDMTINSWIECPNESPCP
jgi:type II secretory pathway pseudopilin PulG